MAIRTTQRLINTGAGLGISMPAKLIKALNLRQGDEVEITVRRKYNVADDNDIRREAAALLQQYNDDFKKLAER